MSLRQRYRDWCVKNREWRAFLKTRKKEVRNFYLGIMCIFLIYVGVTLLLPPVEEKVMIVLIIGIAYCIIISILAAQHLMEWDKEFKESRKVENV